MTSGGLDRESAAGRFETAVTRLAEPTARWFPHRWQRACPRPAADGSAARSATRADEVYGLVIRLATWGADAEGVRRRVPPRLENDTSLPDQLAVLAADLVASADEELLESATVAVREVSRRVLD